MPTTNIASPSRSGPCRPRRKRGCRLPRSLAARGRLDDIVARAEADLAFRDALIANLEEALRLEGYEPDAISLDELRRRLDELSSCRDLKKGAALERPDSREVPACCGLTSEPVPGSASRPRT